MPLSFIIGLLSASLHCMRSSLGPVANGELALFIYLFTEQQI